MQAVQEILKQYDVESLLVVDVLGGRESQPIGRPARVVREKTPSTSSKRQEFVRHLLERRPGSPGRSGIARWHLSVDHQRESA